MEKLTVLPGTHESLPNRFREPEIKPYRSALTLPAGVSQQALVSTCVAALGAAQGVEIKVPPVPEGEVKRVAANEGRSLVDPGQFSDGNLRRYLTLLAPLALSPSSASTYPNTSPRLVPLLLGGVNFLYLEEMTERALALMGFEEEDVDPTLTFAMRLIGFGAGHRHQHFDALDVKALNPMPGEEPEDHLRRIANYTPQVMAPTGSENRYGLAASRLRETKGPFAECLLHAQLYGFELDRKVLRHKWDVMAEATRLFSLHSGVIPEASRLAICASGAKWMDDTAATPQRFAEAVRYVFERPWHELDLVGSVPDDVVKVMARLLIQRLGRANRGSSRYTGRISARALVGMSLLTGIPTTKFVRFAIEELERRGETFLTPEIVRRAVQLVDESEAFQYASSAWMEEMGMLAMRMETGVHSVREYFAFRIRQGNAPLTSTQGVYQIVDFDDEENPKYKPRIDRRLMGLHEEM